MVCRGFGDPVEGGLSAGDFVEDLVGGFGPDEELGVVVPVGDIPSRRGVRTSKPLQLNPLPPVISKAPAAATIPPTLQQITI